MITFSRNGTTYGTAKFTACADNGTRLVLIVGNAGHILDAYVIAHGFGVSSLYNCVNRNVGDLRRLFHKLAKADFVTAAYVRESGK